MSENRGRPASSKPRTTRVYTRLTDEELEMLEYIEYIMGLSRSDALRKALKMLYNLAKNMD